MFNRDSLIRHCTSATAVCVVLTTLACGWLLASPRTLRVEPVETYKPAVNTRVVTSETVAPVLRRHGVVRAAAESRLVPEVAGRIVWMADSLVDGGRFSAGDKLIEIDPSDYEDRVAEAQAALAKANAELKLAAADLKRAEKLFERGLISSAERENRANQHAVTRASRDAASVAVKQAERELSRTSVVAPFSGFVRSESVDLGLYVNKGETLATIFSSDRVEVRASLSANDFKLLRYKDGLTGEHPALVTLSARKTQAWRAKVVRVAAEVDRDYQSHEVILHVINSEGDRPLMPGMVVNVAIEGAPVEGVYVVPRSAVYDDRRVAVVAEGRVRLKAVEVLAADGDNVFVVDGLVDGDAVCLSRLPLLSVSDGMEVVTHNNVSG